MSLRIRYFVFGALIASLSLYYYFYDSVNLYARLSIYSLQPAFLEKKSILIVNMDWDFILGKNEKLLDSCPIASSCFVTKDPRYLQNTSFDAFVIHAPSTYYPWSYPNRTANQVFVYFTLEPPQNMPQQTSFNDYYKWTMTNRLDSDIIMQYGRIEALPGAPQTQQRRLEVFARSAKDTQWVKNKTKLAAWMVSNCNAPSNRQLYVKELQKYMQVDVYSNTRCLNGTNTCPRTEECWSKLQREYKFYLSFENTICDDYVTEKFYDMMGRNIVPVVLGGANYSAFAPPHSYVNALDYKPQQLADFLKKIDANDSLYAQYFWWKPYYKVKIVRHTGAEAFCELCMALQKTLLKRKTIKSTHGWYIKQVHCTHQPVY